MTSTGELFVHQLLLVTPSNFQLDFVLAYTTPRAKMYLTMKLELFVMCVSHLTVQQYTGI